MEPERWQRIKRLLDQALDTDEEALADFLTAQCEADPELRREVESLLEGRSKMEGFIERPILTLKLAPAVDIDVAEPPEDLQGYRLGPYELRGCIGRGGMGSVYQAERADSEYRGRVAIKILHRGMDSDEIVRRFRSERQILANLNHDNVARLFDGGTTTDGRPYLVMEFVDGIPVDQYCDRNRLSIRRRIQLFGRICQAVEFAHRNLVVHRDLKPANILIAEGGVPKLLDFGIAKLLAPDPEATRTGNQGLRIMTPAYASPEQLRGEAVTTASDTYSLGVLLYELLSGRRPFHIPTGQWRDAIRLLEQQTPTAPSAVVLRHQELLHHDGSKRSIAPERISRDRSTSPTKLSKLLRGDLDSIAFKALQQNPSERYATVAELLGDLLQYLDGRPVHARRLTAFYRAKKFIRRNRGKVATLAALALALSSLSYAGFQQSSANRERLRSADQQRRAHLEMRKAEDLEEFLLLFLSGPDPDKKRWRNAQLRDVLDHGAVLVPTELESLPEVQSTLMSTIGRVYHRLGLYKQAEPLLTASLRTRLEIFDETNEQVAYSQIHLGRLLADLRQLDRAEDLTRRGIESLRIAPTEQRPWLLKAENNLATILRHQGRYQEAEKLYLRVLEEKRDVHGETHPDVALGLHNLAAVTKEQGRALEAELLYRESLEIREASGTEDTQSMATTLSNLGALLQDRGDLEEASEALRKSLKIRNQLFPSGANRSLAVAWNNLGVNERMLGNIDSAEDALRKAAGILEEIDQVERGLYGIVLRNLAEVLTMQGQLRLAETKIEQAIEILTQSLGADSWRIADAQSVLGGVLVESNRYLEAEPLLNESFEALLNQKAKCPRQFREAGERLGRLYSAQGQPELAREVTKRYLEATDS